MPWARIVIDPVSITLESPLYVGSGFGYGLVDGAVVRDARSHPYIPGSSIKGRVREACERLAAAYNLRVCHPPHPGHMCGGRKGRRCIVCRIFGSPGGSEGDLECLHWDNAHLVSPWVEAVGDEGLTCNRTQVAVSRRRGVAQEGLLFSQEFASAGLSFQTAITGFLHLTPVAGEKGIYYELILLLAGLRMVDSLGGKRSGGAGRCRLALPPRLVVYGDGEQQELQTSVLAGDLDLLELYEAEAGGE